MITIMNVVSGGTNETTGITVGTDTIGTKPDADAAADDDGLSDGDEIALETDSLDWDSHGGGMGDGEKVLVEDTGLVDPDDDAPFKIIIANADRFGRGGHSAQASVSLV